MLDFYAPRIAAPEPLFVRSAAQRGSAEIGHFYQRALAVDRLRDSEERFSSTMELAAIGIAHVDDTGRFIYVNPQLCEMLDYTEQELLELTVKQVSHPGDVERHRRSARQAPLGRDQVVQDGEALPAQGRLADLGGAHDRVQSATAPAASVYDISVVEDISVAQARGGADAVPRHARRSHRACRIARCSVSCLSLAIETAQRYDRKFAVLFIDLDRFKVINDTLGHEAGDVLLREMAARLRECVRASDVVAPARRRRVRRAAAGDQRSGAGGRRWRATSCRR